MTQTPVPRAAPTVNWNLVQVRWRVVRLDGTNPTGTLELRPVPKRFKDLGTAPPTDVLTSAIVGDIVNGVASVTVPASDDPDVTPTGFAYQVTERVNGYDPVSYFIEVPLSAAAAGLDLASVSPITVGSSGVPVTLVTLSDFASLTGRVTALEGGGGGGGLDVEAVRDAIGSTLVNGTNIQIVVSDVGNTVTIGTTATVNQSDAYLTDRAHHSGEQPISSVTNLGTTLDDIAAIASRLAVDPADPTTLVYAGTTRIPALVSGVISDVQLPVRLSESSIADQITNAGGVHTVNDASGDVVVTFVSLADTDIVVAPPTFDDDGVLIAPSADDWKVPYYNGTTGRWEAAFVDGTKHSHALQYAPVGYVPDWFVPMFVYDSSNGETVPDGFPADGLLFDEAAPTADRIQVVNTIVSSGAAATIPDVTVATIHDVTLTNNCVLTFPALAPGKKFLLLLRQDTTGNRTVTWPASVRWPNPGTAPVLSTASQTEDLFEFTCIGGTNWRGKLIDRYGAAPQPGPTPTVRGVFSANAGAANNLTSVSSTYPNGIVAGDICYMIQSVSGTTDTVTAPAGFSVVSGPNAGTSSRAYLFRKVMAGTESGTSITSGVVSAGQRPAMSGIVIAGGTTTGEVVVTAADTTVDPLLDVPAITPIVGNSLLVHLAAIRSSPSATPESVTPATGWTERVEHFEGRLDGTNVNFGGYIETKALAGQANSEQAATTATYAINANDITYVVAVPPPVA